MAERRTSRTKAKSNGANVAWEADLWEMTDELRDDKRWTVIDHSGMPTVEINKRWLSH